VILQYLLCDSLNGQWKLSKEYLIEDLPDPQHGRELVHLSWDPTGVELAVIDVFGRISIFGVYITVNRMSLLRRCLVDPEDSLAGVVGMMWLNVDKPVRPFGTRTDEITKTPAGLFLQTCDQE